MPLELADFSERRGRLSRCPPFASDEILRQLPQAVDAPVCSAMTDGSVSPEVKESWIVPTVTCKHEQTMLSAGHCATGNSPEGNHGVPVRANRVRWCGQRRD